MRHITLSILIFVSARAYAQEYHLYNGSEYTAFYRGMRGHSFLISDTLISGDIFYDGALYKNIPLGYNIADNQVYIRNTVQGFNIRLLNEKISWFIISGRKFINLGSSLDNTHAGFYELLYDGHIKVYAFREKKIKRPASAEDPMYFRQYDDYFIAIKNRLQQVSNLASALSALPGKDEEIKKIVRSQRLNFKKEPGNAIVAVARYYDRNTTWRDTDTIIQQTPDSAKVQTARKLPSLEENRVFEFGIARHQSAKNMVSLAGYVKDGKTGESIIGATVSSMNSTVITDQFGYYSITLQRGRHEIIFSSSGMKDARRQIILNDDGKLDVELNGQVASLKAVIVVAEKSSNVKSTQMSVEKLTIKNIRQVPVVLGEADVMRVVMTLPGVSSAGEVSTGFNVRGGSVDQNLILFNEATIYNPSHVFGFFSAFNPDLVKSVELYKSAIPEKFGGRLSSVLDVSSREGNSKKISGTGGIGPLTSKLTLEGPVFSEKTTFIAGARSSYSNWLLRNLSNDSYSNSRASFYDLNMNLNHKMNQKNNLYLTGYLSNDRFRLNNDTTYAYGNANWNVKWKHIFSNKIYGILTVGQDRYKYSVDSEGNHVDAFKLAFDIRQAHFRTAFSYSPSNNHQVEFGINGVYYQLQPGSYQPNSNQSLVISKKLQDEQALESAFYIGDRYTITPNFSLNMGLRYSLFNYLGPYNVYEYTPGIPKDSNTITGSTPYQKGKVIKTYHAPEYRLSARYSLSENASVKASFNTTRQYIHMLSNTTIASPTDTWKLSDADIPPQHGYQWSAGFYRNFRGNAIETSIEVYYKTMKNVLDFKSGARLIMNQHIAADVISAKGKSYGAELMLKKVTGKLNGWISYTYSRTMLQQDDQLAGETINRGEYYPASFDKPHNLNVIGNYRFTHRFSMSTNLVYTSGRPITLPVAIFNFAGGQRVYYSERNQFRVPHYFRADLSFTLEGNHKVKQRMHNSWSFGFYNLTARKNPYSVYFTQENGVIKGHQLSIFGTVIPFVTYNFKF